MIDHDDTQNPKGTDGRLRSRDVALLVTFACVAGVLVVSIVRSNRIRNEVRPQIKTAEARLVEITEMNRRLKQAVAESQNNKKIIWDVLRQCRVAADMPDIQCDQIFVQHRGAEGFACWVPSGSHRLVISSKWGAQPQSLASVDDSGESEVPTGEKSWTVPLSGSTGYLLRLNTDRGGGSVDWTLSANAEDFVTTQETIPVDGFSSRGSSYSGSNLAMYPNQAERLFRMEDYEAAARKPPAIKVFDVKLNGKHRDASYVISVTAYIESDGPAHISADDAFSLIVRKRADLLSPYAGNGRYELRPPAESNSSPPFSDR